MGSQLCFYWCQLLSLCACLGREGLLEIVNTPYITIIYALSAEEYQRSCKSLYSWFTLLVPSHKARCERHGDLIGLT